MRMRMNLDQLEKELKIKDFNSDEVIDLFNKLKCAVYRYDDVESLGSYSLFLETKIEQYEAYFSDLLGHDISIILK